RARAKGSPKATSALVSMSVRFSHLRYAHTVRVLVRLFASYREAAGRGHFDLELPAGATVRDAIARILKAHPLIAEGRQVVIARNRDYFGVDEPLADGDELALIPPVSGGDARTLAPIAVSEAPLSIDDALALVRDDAFGGVVVFLGTVRIESRGKRILHLEYEAYAEMAEAKMREISDRLVREHGPLRIAMHHRVGDLRVGDIAVVVAAAAPHRDAAFAVARAARRTTAVRAGTVHATGDRQSVLRDPANPSWSHNRAVVEAGARRSVLGDSGNPYWSHNTATPEANDAVVQRAPRPY